MSGSAVSVQARELASPPPQLLTITVQPSRIKLTDARPSLSYRIFLDALRTEPHWVEIALADHPDLFAASARGQRTPENFFSTRALGRLPARRGETLFVVPPWVLQRLAGASRLYHAVAAYADAEEGLPVSVHAPGAAAVYVDLSGFTGTSLGRLFGAPNPRGGLVRYPKPEPVAASSELSLLWAGDMPRPGTEAGPEANAQSAPTQLMGTRPMHRPQNGILHQSAYRNGHGATTAAPPPSVGADTETHHRNGNGNGNGMHVQNGNGNGNGNGTQPHHSNGGNGMPTNQMPDNGNGNGGNRQAVTYRPEEYDDGHGPMAEAQGLLDWLSSTTIGGIVSEIAGWLQAARERHESFVVGVPNTSFFPFSAICRISGPQGAGTGFYIAPGIILTAAHVLENQGSVTVTAGQNGPGDPGLAQFTVSSGDWTLHPNYDGSDSFDLAVMRVSTPPPNGHHFNVIDYSPAADTPLAICGYGATCDNLSLDGEIQHLDVGRLGALHADFEGMDVAVLACRGTSGSPAFVEGPMMSGDHDPSLIPVMGILVSGPTDIDNNICLLTPDKIDWALSGGTLAVSQGYTQVHQGRGAPARQPMSQPMCPGPYTRNGAGVGNGHARHASGQAMPSRRPQMPARQMSSGGDAISAHSLGDVLSEIVERLRRAQQRVENWIVGVPDTSFFPFSSICHLEMNFGGNTYFGTGFYISHDRILTVGHNLWDLSSGTGPDSVRVRAGRNGNATLSDFTVMPGQWEVHPNYLSGGGTADFDLGIIYAPEQPPGPNWFELINFSPAPDTATAICGHGMRNFNNQEVLDHTKQHLDIGRIGELLPGGEAMRMDILAMRGHSGSPCFVEGGMTSGGNHPGDMPVMGVLSQIDPEHDGYICLLTPDKIQWAVGQSLPEYSGGMRLGHARSVNGHPGQPRLAPGRSRAMSGNHHHAQAQTAPPVWVPIVAEVGSAAAAAGVTALANSSGDVAWSVQSMNGWMRPGEFPTAHVPVEPASIRTQEVDLASPIYDAVMGDVFAHFRLRFGYDGAGIGQIVTDPAPYSISDPWGKGLKVRMMIEPLTGTYHAQGNPSQQVAAVQVTMHYEYEHTFADSTFVQYIYTLYGDGTYESRIDPRAGPLSEIDIDYAPGHPYRR